MFENITAIVQNFQSFNYYRILSNLIGPSYLELLIFTIGMVIYVVFVWFFYQKLAKRDIFELNLEKYDLPEVKWRGLKKLSSSFLYVLKYWIVFPIYVFVWFVILSIFLFFMAKYVPVRQVTLISIALVAAIRVTSYFNEDLSKDLAKVMPFAILVNFLTEPDFFSWDLLMNRLKTLPTLWEDILQFVAFAVFLEWGLRIFYGIKSKATRKKINSEIQPTASGPGGI